MATYDLPILGSFTRPDTNGDTFWNPAAINFGSNDRYSHMLVEFTSQSARRGIGGAFRVPQNYVGTPVLVIEWATTATTGNVAWDIDYTAVGGDDAESLDPSTDQQTATVTDSASGTARRKMTATISLTAGNFAANDIVLFNFVRDAADAADTLAATAYLFGLYFRYADV